MSNSILNEIRNSINNFIEDSYINFRLLFLNKTRIFLFIILFILFIYLAYFVYSNYLKNILNKKHVLNKELVNNPDDLENNDSLIVFFKTEWCPYCKQSMGEWNEFKDYVNKINNTNKTQITLSIIDCDEKPIIADKYNIEAYPTIKMFYKGEIYDYDAKPNKTNLIEFLESIVVLN